MRTVTHFVDGKPWTGGAARQGEVFDPATGQVSAHVDLASTSDVDAVVASEALLHGRFLVLRRGKRTFAGVEVTR